jgi:hypothetical protein
MAQPADYQPPVLIAEQKESWSGRWESNPFPPWLYAYLRGFLHASNAQKRTGTPANCYKLLQLFILCETGTDGKCDEKLTNKTTMKPSHARARSALPS